MTAERREAARPEEPATHLAVGYADRGDLDDFIERERGDLVVHGPIHTGADVAAVGTLGAGATAGTPCLIVPLIRERMDEIRREVDDALDRFAAQRPPAAPQRPHSIRETGGTARGTSSGAIRLGAERTEDR